MIITRWKTEDIDEFKQKLTVTERDERRVDSGRIYVFGRRYVMIYFINVSYALKVKFLKTL